MPLRADSLAIVGGTSDGLLITLIAWQPLNAYSPMVVKFSHLNKSSDFSERQPLNAYAPMVFVGATN